MVSFPNSSQDLVEDKVVDPLEKYAIQVNSSGFIPEVSQESLLTNGNTP